MSKFRFTDILFAISVRLYNEKKLYKSRKKVLHIGFLCYIFIKILKGKKRCLPCLAHIIIIAEQGEVCSLNRFFEDNNFAHCKDSTVGFLFCGGTMNELRVEIDRIDEQICMLLDERTALVRQIGEVKKSNNLPIEQNGRETSVLDKISRFPLKNIPVDAAQRIFSAIFNEMKQIQKGL